MLTAKKLAKKLHSRQSDDSITQKELRKAKENGLVIVLSRDVGIKLCGAIDFESDVNDVHLNVDGIVLNDWEIDCDNPLIPRVEKIESNEFMVEVVTNIPHEEFVIMDDIIPAFKGIVFSSHDLAMVEWLYERVDVCLLCEDEEGYWNCFTCQELVTIDEEEAPLVNGDPFEEEYFICEGCGRTVAAIKRYGSPPITRDEWENGC